MTRQINFKFDKDTKTTTNSIKDYFVKSGFQVLSESSNEVEFGQGSTIQNIITFNPLKWKSKIAIKIQNNEVFADFDINTSWQMVSLKEEKLWDTFINNFQTSVIDNVDLSAENKSMLLVTKRDSWNKIMWCTLGAVIFGVPAGVLANFTGLDMLAPTGAIVGGLFLMMYKMRRDENKNAD